MNNGTCRVQVGKTQGAEIPAVIIDTVTVGGRYAAYPLVQDWIMRFDVQTRSSCPDRVGAARGLYVVSVPGDLRQGAADLLVSPGEHQVPDFPRGCGSSGDDPLLPVQG